MLWLALIGGVVSWLVVQVVIDRVSTPAWQGRNAYRSLCLILLCCLFVASLKALGWYAELKALIASCH